MRQVEFCFPAVFFVPTGAGTLRIAWGTAALYPVGNTGLHARFEIMNLSPTSDPQPRQSGPHPDGATFPAAGSGTLGQEEKRFLLELARRTVREAVASGDLPELDESIVPATLTGKKGCFVTLTKKGELRGCIGNIFPAQPLFRAVMENARSAAIHDHRFSAVTPAELPELEYEISLLTQPSPLAFDSPEELLRQLRPHVDGVVLKVGGRSSTFLPQVWEHFADKEDFLDRLAMKSGGLPTDWRRPDATVLTYQVEAFCDAEV